MNDKLLVAFFMFTISLFSSTLIFTMLDFQLGYIIPGIIFLPAVFSLSLLITIVGVIKIFQGDKK